MGHGASTLNMKSTKATYASLRYDVLDDMKGQRTGFRTTLYGDYPGISHNFTPAHVSPRNPVGSQLAGARVRQRPFARTIHGSRRHHHLVLIN